MDLDNKLDLIWITDMITNKITDKITDMTNKLQMLITFATVVRLRPTIYLNAQNLEENPDKGIWYTIFCQKEASNCLNFVFKDQTPTFFLLFLFFYFFKKNSATLFFLYLKESSNRFSLFFFYTTFERNKKQEKRTRTKT